MARRTEHHVTGDIGVAEVSRILSAVSWACERVASDYGEDLICQIGHNGIVDSHRILVQVKTTKHGFRQRRSVSVKKGTMLKWLRDANLVVVVMWSLADKKAYFILPSEEYSAYDFDDEETERNFSTKFEGHRILNDLSAERIAWLSRIRNLNRNFLEIRNLRDTAHRGDFDTQREFKLYKNALGRKLTSLIVQFLKYIDILQGEREPYRLNTHAFREENMRFGEELFYACKNIEVCEKLSLSLSEILALVILRRAQRSIPGIAFPPALIDDSYRFYSLQIKELTKGLGEKNVVGLAKRLWVAGAKVHSKRIPD
jgi:Domain of unknown function (DUF4365)